MRSAEAVRGALARAAYLAALARDAAGTEKDRVDQALALLEEARAWLPQPRRAKGPRPPRPEGRGPELLLFRAVQELRGVRGLVEKELRSRTVPSGLFRVKELLEAARAQLREAWLAYLYAQGLPSHLKPWRAFPWLGGLVSAFVSLVMGFLSAYLRFEGKNGVDWRAAVSVLAWIQVVHFMLGRRVYRRGKLSIVRKDEVFRRLWPYALGLPALPALGILFRPDLAKVFGLFSLAGLAAALPYIIQAARLLFLSGEARVLVLPRLFVAFLPRLASWSEERVFLS
ncbi:MAG: hypothetical protein NZ651_04820 [Candidatus Bipolaricaulota bacterium]|nr:hypothetical protein [Candidatus Bipolaricaulota bacterium]MDW8127076.1 hypothetical protein [Candidatus Bipolaricaulota bacterium]